MSKKDNSVLEAIKKIATHTINVARLGIVIGGIIGILALFFAQSRIPTIIGDYAASYFPILIIALPLGLLGVFVTASEDRDVPLFTSRSDAFVTLIIAGFLGGLLGSLFAVVVILNIMAIFGGVDIFALNEALLNSIGAMNFLYVTLATGITGIVGAIWYQRRF